MDKVDVIRNFINIFGMLSNIAKNYIRYASRQKRADARRALKDLLFNNGSPKFSFQDEDSTWKIDGASSWDEEADHSDSSNKKGRPKSSNRRGRKAQHNRFRRESFPFYFFSLLFLFPFIYVIFLVKGSIFLSSLGLELGTSHKASPALYHLSQASRARIKEIDTRPNRPVQPVQPSTGHIYGPVYSIKPFGYWTGHEPPNPAVGPVTQWNQTVLNEPNGSSYPLIFPHPPRPFCGLSLEPTRRGDTFALNEDGFYRHPLHLHSSQNPMWDC
ncbi:hypothetical protein CK203_080295 [Vitis vinifera]|uniref:Uncharacterized protein n=1 Tax=Vitis vinifera TaxID=29760 RepID=A0A438CNL6_VITVI|nr:hypothetical protein CK203_080295 [Vitis vinifera]